MKGAQSRGHTTLIKGGIKMIEAELGAKTAETGGCGGSNIPASAAPSSSISHLDFQMPGFTWKQNPAANHYHHQQPLR